MFRSHTDPAGVLSERPPALLAVASRNLARLRPSKLRSGTRRRLFTYRVSHFPAQPVGELVEVGTVYGGWVIPADVDATWTCYCIGMGGDLSLERHLLERGARVRSVDPVERFVVEGRDEFEHVGRFTAHHAAVATWDGVIEMQRHHEAVSSSLSAAHLYDSAATVTVPAITLSSLMDALGDSHIDLLKVDVEGLEYELIPTLDLAGIGLRALAVQVHHNGSVSRARELVAAVEAQGYVYAAQRPACKLLFVAPSAAAADRQPEPEPSRAIHS